MCELKNPFKVPGPSHGSCWREQNCLSLWGPDALICRIYNFFYKDQKEKNWGLVAWPVSALGWLCIRRIPLDEIGVVRPPEKGRKSRRMCINTTCYYGKNAGYYSNYSPVPNISNALVKTNTVPKRQNKVITFLSLNLLRRHFHEWLKGTTKTSLKNT